MNSSEHRTRFKPTEGVSQPLQHPERISDSVWHALAAPAPSGIPALSALGSLTRELHERSQAILQMPPRPATARGRMGAPLLALVRRALFWLTPQVAEMHRLTASVLDGLVAAMAQSRDTNQELRAKCEELAYRCRLLEDEIEVRRRREATNMDAVRARLASLEQQAL